MSENRQSPDDQEDRAVEAAWIRRAQQRDVAAYDELVRRYQGRIYALVYNMTSNNADAEDLVQEIFFKAYKSLHRFRGKSSFYTWIYRIAVNQAINFIKKRKKQAAMSLNALDGSVENDPAFLELTSGDTPFRDATLTDLQEKLNEALQKLSDKHRTVVVLHDVQGVPHDEIGKMLRCSTGTVRSRLFYARQQLQAELSEWVP